MIRRVEACGEIVEAMVRNRHLQIRVDNQASHIQALRGQMEELQQDVEFWKSAAEKWERQNQELNKEIQRLSPKDPEMSMDDMMEVAKAITQKLREPFAEIDLHIEELEYGPDLTRDQRVREIKKRMRLIVLEAVRQSREEVIGLFNYRLDPILEELSRLVDDATRALAGKGA